MLFFMCAKLYLHIMFGEDVIKFQLLYLSCPATICVPPLCLTGGYSVWKDYVHTG